jgi:small-conductance mechanosensitive channel
MGDYDQIISALRDAWNVASIEAGSRWVQAQLAVLAITSLLAPVIAGYVRRRADPVALTMGWPAFVRLAVRAVLTNLTSVVFVLLLVVGHVALLAAAPGNSALLLRPAVSLAAAWVLIHLAAGFIRNPLVLRLVTLLAWSIAALSLLGLLEPISEILDAAAISMRGMRISALLVLKTLGLLIISLWAASATSDFIESRARRASDLTPSVQVLIAKLSRVTLISLAIVVVLGSIGIDLTAVALFSGALGVGIGFGLQKIVSNFLCGIILLVDKSIKPGDVITVGDGLGWVVAMGARHTTVTTRDGRESSSQTKTW